MTSKLVAILTAEGFVESIHGDAGLPVGFVLKSTSFYSEAGGQVIRSLMIGEKDGRDELCQVGDSGSLQWESGRAEIVDCKVAAGYVLHICNALSLGTEALRQFFLSRHIFRISAAFLELTMM